MFRTTRLPFLSALLCGAAAAAQAQVMGIQPPIFVVQHPKAYIARDLGPVAETRSIGCLARNGALALTRPVDESGNRVARAVLPGGSSYGYGLFAYPGYHSWVNGCSSSGEYVGVSAGHGGGVVWDSDWNTGPHRLGSGAAGPNEPTAINDARQVVGTITNSLGQPHGARWDTAGVTTNPAPVSRTLLPGVATDINAQGEVTLTQMLPGQPTRAVLYAANGVNYSYLPIPGAVASTANALDGQSRVVGLAQDAAGARRGYLWHASEGFVQLQPARHGVGPMQHAEARAIGLNRTVVGQSSTLAAGQPALLAATVWINAGIARNLNYETQMNDNSVLPRLVDAIAVSDAGAILVEGRTAGGERRALLLTPNPSGRWGLIP